MMDNRRGRRHGTRSVRRALLGASLALSARGAFAAVPGGGSAAFTATSTAAGDGALFANSATIDCSDLYVVISSGLLDGATDGAAGAALATPTHVKGLLKNAATLTGTSGTTPADITECVVAPGAYLHTAATATTAAGMEALKVFTVPANHYAVGGPDADTATGTDTWDGSAALSGSATAGVTKCPYAGTSAAGSSVRSDCTPDCSTTNANSGAEALAGTCYCSAGSYSSGSVGSGQPDDTNGAAAAAAKDGCTKCSTTFSSATAASITSVLASSAKTACKVKAGSIITTAAGTADAHITVGPAPAGTFQPDAIVLATKGAEDSIPTTCPANSNSDAGSAFCTCDDGYIPSLGGEGCQPYAAAAAAAASPTADSAGASTPIAVALAAAAAVPLLL